jgi:ubiquinone/menaquinone biosynthesis C-methylase UbiE
LTSSPFARELFFRIHEGLPRQAPGSEACTLQALDLTGFYGGIDGTTNGAINVLDVACGPGLHTLHLARALPDARITGVDAHAPYLDELMNKIETHGFADRVQCQRADMKGLPFPDASFDLIWCEAAVYIMGFRNALESWRRLLKPGARMAISDLVWLQEDRPAEAIDYWTAYPDMTTLEERRVVIKSAGYHSLGDFVLPEQAWMDPYYQPMQTRINALRQQYANDPVHGAQAEDVLAASEKEITVFRNSGGSYGYAFFVMAR